MTATDTAETLAFAAAQAAADKKAQDINIRDVTDKIALTDVFVIVNEESRQPAPNPVERVLREARWQAGSLVLDVQLDHARVPEHLLPFHQQEGPEPEPAEPEPWLGRRPCFPDSRPVIGRAPGQAGLWLCYGHGHYGLTLGPVSGRLISEMMTGATPFTDPKPFGAERFGPPAEPALAAAVEERQR